MECRPDLTASSPRGCCRGVQLQVTPRKISFALGNFEPFYGVLALYDMAKKVKISENFYFDVNDDDVSSSYSSLPR